MMRFTLLSVLLLIATVSVSAAQDSYPLLASRTIEHKSTAESESTIARHAQLAQALTGPVYPARGVEFGIEGEVRVRFTVDEKGRTRDAVIEEGLGRVFDKEALRVIRKARFTPALDTKGKPIAATYVTTFVFSLDETR